MNLAASPELLWDALADIRRRRAVRAGVIAGSNYELQHNARSTGQTRVGASCIGVVVHLAAVQIDVHRGIRRRGVPHIGFLIRLGTADAQRAGLHTVRQCPREAARDRAAARAAGAYVVILSAGFGVHGLIRRRCAAGAGFLAVIQRRFQRDIRCTRARAGFARVIISAGEGSVYLDAGRAGREGIRRYHLHLAYAVRAGREAIRQRRRARTGACARTCARARIMVILAAGNRIHRGVRRFRAYGAARLAVVQRRFQRDIGCIRHAGAVGQRVVVRRVDSRIHLDAGGTGGKRTAGLRQVRILRRLRQRFLSLLPYTALSALIFPGVFSVDAAHPLFGIAGAAAAAVLALKKCPLIVCVLAAVGLNCALYLMI